MMIYNTIIYKIDIKSMFKNMSIKIKYETEKKKIKQLKIFCHIFCYKHESEGKDEE